MYSKRKLPVNFNEQDLNIFKHELSYTIPNSAPISINKITIHPYYDFLFSKNNFKWSNQYSYKGSPSRIDQLKYLAAILLTKNNNIEEGVWITNNWSDGYFHFLLDCLPRFININKTDCPIILPKRYKDIKFITDILNFLELDFIFIEKVTLIKKLHTCLDVSETGNYNPILINKLRNLFLSKLTGVHKREKKIYISRARAPKRHIANEEILFPILKNHNIEIHHFEDLKFAEQVQLIASSTLIIGIHGAGLANMLFAQENTKILELRFEDDKHNNCYFSLASDLNLNYYYQLNKRVDTTDNMIVDPNEFEKLVQSL